MRATWIFGLLLLVSSVALAQTTLKEVSDSLSFGVEILSKVMWAACIVVGIALIAAAFTQFQIHRRNPKLVPLTTPVLYLILGICAIGIPFLDRVMGFSEKSPQKIERSPSVPRRQQYNPRDIDAPLY